MSVSFFSSEMIRPFILDLLTKLDCAVFVLADVDSVLPFTPRMFSTLEGSKCFVSSQC